MIAISVVMPTYNTAVPVLKEAVDSILNQTIRDFEFIIIDDRSTNDSLAYLNALKDPRIHIIRNKENLGITKSLNIGFRVAKGKYIARMDSDDISMPNRLECQLIFMERHPDVIVCGSEIQIIGKQSHNKRKRKMEDMESYRIRMLFRNPGPVHSTAFFNHEKLLEYHIEYDERLIYAQDYGMWKTISQCGVICILPETLLQYRLHSNQISKVYREKQILCDQMTQRELLLRLLDTVSEEELNLHYYYSSGYYKNLSITPKICNWYDRLIQANSRKRIYNQRLFKTFIYKIKCSLIEQTFQNDMTKIEKVFLFFRFLSFSSAIKAVLRAIVKKAKVQLLRDI